jgi:hypothetical protein
MTETTAAAAEDDAIQVILIYYYFFLDWRALSKTTGYDTINALNINCILL